MTISIKKLVKPARHKSFFILVFSIPLIIFAKLATAEESLEERINQLELQLKQLRVQIKSEKKTGTTNTEKKQSNRPNSKHDYQFGGFVKATATFSDYSDGDLAAGSGLRDFLYSGSHSSRRNQRKSGL